MDVKNKIDHLPENDYVKEGVHSSIREIYDREYFNRFEFTDDIIFGLELYTPEICQELLDATTMYDTTPNNKLSEYVNDMKNGNWEIVGDSICFDTNGQIVSGVARLHAIIESGVNLVLPTTRNLSPRTINTSDMNAMRTFANSLKIKYPEIKNLKHLVALVRALMDYDEGYYNGNRRGVRNPAVLLAYYDSLDNKEEIDFIVSLATSKYRNSSKSIKPKLFLFLYYIFYKSNPELATIFADGMAGIGLTEDSPITAFLNKTTAAKDKTNFKLNERDIVRYGIIAWSKLKTGTPCYTLKLPLNETNYNSLI